MNVQLRTVPPVTPSISAIVVSATLDPDGSSSLRGHLDLCSADAVEGWALDLDDLGTPMELELLVGQRVVERCRTEFPRADLQVLTSELPHAGFRFARHGLQALRYLIREVGGDPVAVRLAGTNLFLPSPGAARTLGEFFAPVSGEEEGFDLVVRLSELRRRGEGMAGLPLRPISTACRGYVEVMAMDEAGSVWMMGWMRRRIVVDCAAMVVDRQKIAGALSFTWYERSDLPEDAAGFIGLLATDWRPTRDAEPVIFLEGDEGDEPVHLRTVSPLKLVPFREFFALWEDHRRLCHPGRTRALWQILQQPDFWSCHAAASRADVRAAIDEAVIVPGFGCIAAGWVLSRFRHIERLSMRLGSAVMTLDPASLCIRPRPDLGSAYPNLSALTDQAGFVCVLRGAVTDRDLDISGQGGVVLKIMFEGGTASNHPVDAYGLHRLGRGAPLNSLAELYPSIQAESFFPDLARAVLQDLQGGIRPIRPHAVVPFRKVAVFPVPTERSNLFLLIDAIHRARQELDGETGIVLIAGNAACRPDVTALFDEIAEMGSLFFMEDPLQVLHALPAILGIVGAERFAFFGQNLHPTEEGWAVVADLDQAGEGIEALEVVDPARSGSGEVDRAGVIACFAWNRAALTSWAAEAPMRLGGTVRSGIPLPPARRHARAAMRGDVTIEDRLTAAINRFAIGAPQA